MNSKSHDLTDFMQAVTQDIAREYERIQKRVGEDPGTAGDQGEENWASVLRNWLPPTYHVVTKGRILSFDGVAGPQIDVLVLQSAYPKHLLNKKLYLAGGVAAAFECKLTLKPEHIKKAVESAVSIKRHLSRRTGSPYRELHSPILYGLLAHSHVWKDVDSKPVDNVERNLLEADQLSATHPREMLDVLCIADLAMWKAIKTPWFGPENVQDWDNGPRNWFVPTTGAPCTVFMCHAPGWKEQSTSFSPIGATIAFLWRHLAWEDHGVRELADYFTVVNLSGVGVGRIRPWTLDIYSDTIRNSVKHKSPKLSPINTDWNEWGSDM